MSITLKNVTKCFGIVSAARGVSFTVEPGELLALLGPSGCGKTTVLRMIAGLERPDEGEIFIAGNCVNNLPVQRREVGFVFQNYALFKNMSVNRNIAFGLKVKGWEKQAIRARVEELIELFGLQELGERYPHQLSGGQRQRVALARSLAPKPRVLLLDEPFGAIDARIRQELREWLVRLHHDLNVTTVFVTHDQEEALEVANRIVIFSRGRVEQIGSPQQVYEEPANEFVARFIGVMNVIEAKVSDGVGRLHELEFPVPDQPAGTSVQIGFRPYSVQVSADPAALRFRAYLRHTYFLGVMMRLELEMASGLVLRARMPKEQYLQNGLVDGREVSFHISQYRIVSDTHAPLGPEREMPA